MVSFRRSWRSCSHRRSPRFLTCPAQTGLQADFSPKTHENLTVFSGQKQNKTLFFVEEKTKTSSMTTSEWQRRRIFLLLKGGPRWVSSYFLKQSGPHIHNKKLVILYIYNPVVPTLVCVLVFVCVVCCLFSSAVFGFFFMGLSYVSDLQHDGPVWTCGLGS